MASWKYLLTAGSIVCLLLPAPGTALAAVGGQLRVADNHRYLQYENGKPFFYLGDTAWELFQRC
jgi:hypothetical protein